jgi:hypothetical protein
MASSEAGLKDTLNKRSSVSDWPAAHGEFAAANMDHPTNVPDFRQQAKDRAPKRRSRN